MLAVPVPMLIESLARSDRTIVVLLGVVGLVVVSVVAHSLGFVLARLPALLGLGSSSGPGSTTASTSGSPLTGRAAAAPRAAADDGPDRAAGPGAGGPAGPAAALARPGLVAGRGQRRGLQRRPARGRSARRVGQPAAAGRHPARGGRRVLSLVLPDLGVAGGGRCSPCSPAGLTGQRRRRRLHRPARGAARLLDPISWRRHGFRVTERALLARRGRVRAASWTSYRTSAPRAWVSSKGRCSAGSGWCRSCWTPRRARCTPRVEHLAVSVAAAADRRAGGPGPRGPGRSRGRALDAPGAGNPTRLSSTFGRRLHVRGPEFRAESVPSTAKPGFDGQASGGTWMGSAASAGRGQHCGSVSRRVKRPELS